MTDARSFSGSDLRLVQPLPTLVPRRSEAVQGSIRPRTLDDRIATHAGVGRSASHVRRQPRALRSIFIVVKSLLIVSILMPLGILALMLCILSVEWIVFDEVRMRFLM